MNQPYIMSMTPDELFRFLDRQITDFELDMDSWMKENNSTEFSYAMGARDAYKFVLRTLIEYGQENK